MQVYVKIRFTFHDIFSDGSKSQKGRSLILTLPSATSIDPDSTYGRYLISPMSSIRTDDAGASSASDNDQLVEDGEEDDTYDGESSQEPNSGKLDGQIRRNTVRFLPSVDKRNQVGCIILFFIIVIYYKNCL